MTEPIKREGTKAILTVPAGEKIVSACIFKGIYVVATEKAVYAVGDERKIKKIFPVLKAETLS